MQLLDPFAVGLGPFVQGLPAVPVLLRPARPVDEDPDRGVTGLDSRIVAVSQHVRLDPDRRVAARDGAAAGRAVWLLAHFGSSSV